MIGLATILKIGTETSGNHGHSGGSGGPGNPGGSSSPDSGVGDSKLTSSKDENKNGQFVDVKLGVKEALASIKNGEWGKGKDKQQLRRLIAMGAINNIQAGKKGLTYKDKGEVTGVMAYKFLPKYLSVEYIATKKEGYGRLMMKEICREAVKKDKGLVLCAIPEAVKFYKTIGMKDVTEGKSYAREFMFTPEQTKEFAKTGHLKTIDNEPENGCFCIPKDRYEEYIKFDKPKHLSENIQKQWKEYLHG